MATSGQQFVDYLMQYLGTPYVWGGNSLSKGVDCSGLVQQGLAHFGINVPRVTNDQIGTGKAVGSLKDLEVGDLVFFDTDPGRQGPDHVGVYAGNGKMIEAPRPGKSVQIIDLVHNDYYTSRFMGARRVNGIIGGGDAGKDGWSTRTDAEKALSPEEMASEYGWSYAFLNSYPDLKDIFSQAVKETWTPEKFQAKIRGTDFWKKNSDVARQNIALQYDDPATWRAKLNATQLTVTQLAAQIGATIPDKKLGDIVKQAATLDMDEGQLRNVLVGYVNFSKGTLKGEAGLNEVGLHQYAQSMGINVSDDTVKNYSQLMIRGLATADDFKAYVNKQAITAFPAFEEQINGGQTIQDVAQPYMQMMADQLEIPNSQITVDNPLIKRALNGVDDQGKPSGLDLTQFQDALTNDPRWRQTQAAQDKTLSIGSQVLKQMGLISG